MPNDDTSYYADLNRPTMLDQFGLPHTFTVEKRDGQLLLCSDERPADILIDEDSDVSPGDEVTVFEKEGKILTSVNKKRQYDKREIEPGVYEVTGTKGPGDKVSSPQEIAETIGAPLPDSDGPDAENPYVENFGPAEEVEEWLSEADGPPVTESLLDAALRLYEDGGTEHHIRRVYENPESFTRFENCLGALFENTPENEEWARATEEFAEQVSFEDGVWVQYDNVDPIMHDVPDENEEFDAEGYNEFLDEEVFGDEPCGSHEDPITVPEALQHYMETGGEQTYIVRPGPHPAFEIVLYRGPEGVRVEGPTGPMTGVLETRLNGLVNRGGSDVGDVAEKFEGKFVMTEEAFRAAAKASLPADAPARWGQTRAPNHADLNYQDYLWDILSEGHESDDRTGTGTIKSFGHQMRFDLQEGFPLLTSKTIDFENVARELLWFLRGRTNVWHLLQNNVGIWTGNAYERYRQQMEFFQSVSDNPDPSEEGLEVLTQDEFEEAIKTCDDPSSLAYDYENFAGLWGDLGEIYGARWRDAQGFDQLENLVQQLQENPDSRRLRVDAWKPRVHMKGAPNETKAALPPCHTDWQVFTRKLSLKERVDLFDGYVGVGDTAAVLAMMDAAGVPRRALSLKWNQRSVDSFLGLPYNIASYALLTHLLAHRVGMVPETLIFSGGDCHIYQNHVDQVEELLSRVPRAELPTLTIGREEPPDDMGDYQFDDLSLEGYDPRPKIQAPLAV